MGTCQEHHQWFKQYGIQGELIITNYVQLNWKLRIIEKWVSQHTATVFGAPKEDINIVNMEILRVWVDIIDETKDRLYGKAKPDEVMVETIDIFSRLIFSCKQRVQGRLAYQPKTVEE